MSSSTFHRIALLVAGVSLLTAVSCSMNQTIVIRADGSGTGSLKVEVSPVLRDYFINLAELSGNTSAVDSGQIFDLKEVKKSFESRPGITVTRTAIPTKTSMEVDISYKSIKTLFTDDSLAGTGVATYTESAGTKTLKFHLDKDNFTKLAVVFPVLSDPLFAGMGPQPNEKMTEDEYLKMIEYSLGADGAAQLAKSFIIITMKPEGQIVSQSGVTLSDGSVVFKIPLIKVLVLNTPLDYSFSWK